MELQFSLSARSFPLLSLLLVCRLVNFAASAIDPLVYDTLRSINADGPLLGLVIANDFEMDPLYQEGVFAPNSTVPFIDISGRRFHVGEIGSQKVIVIMSGEGMVNAGISTQLLLTYFDICGVLHCGISGNANDELHIGDVTIPRFWAHTGLLYWQRYGKGPNDELANGYTKTIGYLDIGAYNNPLGNTSNYLSNLWYQAQEVFLSSGTPEVSQKYFWLPVDKAYFTIASEIVSEDLDLRYCSNETNCLSSKPQVVTVARGASADIFVDNAAYRSFLHDTFDVSAIDMETAAVALACLTNNVSFIAFRGLSDLAGGSDVVNEVSTFYSVPATNAIIVLQEFLSLLQKNILSNA